MSTYATRPLRTYTIFHNALDYPGKFVTRGFTIAGGGAIPDPLPLAVVDTLALARAAVPPEADHRVPADPDEEPQIIETWI